MTGEPLMTGESPLRLTELGKKVSSQVGAKEWAWEHAPKLGEQLGEVKEYAIQQVCFEYAENRQNFSPRRLGRIQDVAYDNGIEDGAVRRVMAVELRDGMIAVCSNCGKKIVPGWISSGEKSPVIGGVGRSLCKDCVRGRSP
ncbi:hypothetical protein [Candidatus Palauibacter sp.]|uniref:hypothetical protein n=1 Tax=Candidatus Palauibacter sp. TaxID=3101350 RepID=UPI003B01BA1C